MPEYNREPARRVFASEFNNSNHVFRESDDERAPKFSLLRSGQKANRVFIVGTVTQTQDVGSESEYWQARIVDPTGTFFLYSGQYSPEETEVIRSCDPPQYMAAVAKVDSFENDDGEVQVSLRAESVAIVDEETRDKWVAETAEATIERLENQEGKYVDMAREMYEDLELDELRNDVVEALQSLKGDSEGESEGENESESEPADEVDNSPEE